VDYNEGFSMMKFLRRSLKLSLFTSILFLFFSGSKGFAQARFTTMVSEKQPDLNEYFQVEYIVENARSVDRIDPPSLKNFRIIQGPSQSTGMTYVNGVMTQSKSISYILQALKAGKQVVPGATAMADGKPVQSENVPIEVKNSGKKSSSGNTPPITPFPGMGHGFMDMEPQVDEEYVLKPGESFQDKVKSNLFVKTDVNKTTCFEGEPIMASFALCSRLKSESRVTKRPSLNGFSVYDMLDPEANMPSVQTIGGKSYNVHMIRKTQLFPLQAGTFIIDPVELDNTVRFVRAAPRSKGPKTNMEQLMEDMMNDGAAGQVEEHNFVLASKPVTITVKPLPVAGKPEGFNGAVGQFTLQQQWRNKVVAAGDALQMDLVIKGAGNFAVISAPAIELPSSIDGYDPTIRENVDKSDYPLSGSKTFSYTFIPRDTGRFTVPAVSFSYFDPSQQSYRSVESQPVEIRVTPATKTSLSKKGESAALQSENSLSALGEFLEEYTFVVVAGTALFVLLIIGIRKQQRRNKRRARRAASTKSKKISAMVAAAPPVPAPTAMSLNIDVFSGARTALSAGASKDFYAQVNRGVWQFISDKLQIPSTDLNKYNVTTNLKAKGIEEDLIQRLNSILNECEIAVYTPVHDEADMSSTLARAEKILEELKPKIA
jgi:hypothetical protein